MAGWSAEFQGYVSLHSECKPRQGQRKERKQDKKREIKPEDKKRRKETEQEKESKGSKD